MWKMVSKKKKKKKKKEAKTHGLNWLKNVWEQKPLHGWDAQRIRNAIDIEKTNQCLKVLNWRQRQRG